MANLQHLLGKKTTEVEKPKPFPVGHYSWMITEFSIVESSKKKTPGIEYIIKMVEPMEDVDDEELSQVKNPNEKKKKLTFWLTDDSLWRLTEFLELIGIDDEERTLEELLPESVGGQFIAAIQHEPLEGSTDVIDRLNDRSIAAIQ